MIFFLNRLTNIDVIVSNVSKNHSEFLFQFSKKLLFIYASWEALFNQSALDFLLNLFEPSGQHWAVFPLPHLQNFTSENIVPTNRLL